MPVVPDSIREPQARADYATAHYWERYDFRDTTLLRADYAEQALSNFIALLSVTSETGRETAIANWIVCAAPHASSFEYFTDMGILYLHGERSPLRDDDLYERFLRHLAETPDSDDATRSRAAFLLRQFVSNRPGTVAADFTCTAPDGIEMTLYRTATDRQTLLFFYDPACDQCRDLIFRLRHSSVINGRIAAGTLTVLAVYPGEDRQLWEETVSELPVSWLVTIDRTGVEAQGLYDLSTMPAVILLDRDKTVLQRNATYHQLTETLTQSTK